MPLSMSSHNQNGMDYLTWDSIKDWIPDTATDSQPTGSSRPGHRAGRIYLQRYDPTSHQLGTTYVDLLTQTAWTIGYDVYTEDAEGTEGLNPVGIVDVAPLLSMDAPSRDDGFSELGSFVPSGQPSLLFQMPVTSFDHANRLLAENGVSDTPERARRAMRVAVEEGTGMEHPAMNKNLLLAYIHLLHKMEHDPELKEMGKKLNSFPLPVEANQLHALCSKLPDLWAEEGSALLSQDRWKRLDEEFQRMVRGSWDTLEEVLSDLHRNWNGRTL